MSVATDDFIDQLTDEQADVVVNQIYQRHGEVADYIIDTCYMSTPDAGPKRILRELAAHWPDEVHL